MRVILAAVLLLSLQACAVPSRVDDGSSPRYRPLNAYLTQDGAHGVAFSVNRPAYVAVFEIVPGGGTSLLYPGPGLGPLDGSTWGYRPLRPGRRANADHFMPMFGLQHGPRFLFMIASERPLNLERIGSYGHGLRSALGVRFASLNAYSVMEDLAELTLPSLEDDGSWTTDLYVYWPQTLYDSPGQHRVLLQCNGYRVYVPVERLFPVQMLLCNPEQLSVPPRDTTGVEEDSTSVSEPGRRPPLPRTEETPLRQRIIASTQLDAPDGERWERAGLTGRERFLNGERPLHPGMRDGEAAVRRPDGSGEPGAVERTRPMRDAESPRAQPMRETPTRERPAREAEGASRPAAPAPRPADAAPAPPPPPPAPPANPTPPAPPRGGETGCNPCQSH